MTTLRFKITRSRNQSQSSFTGWKHEHQPSVSLVSTLVIIKNLIHIKIPVCHTEPNKTDLPLSPALQNIRQIASLTAKHSARREMAIILKMVEPRSFLTHVNFNPSPEKKTLTWA